MLIFFRRGYCRISIISIWYSEISVDLRPSITKAFGFFPAAVSVVTRVFIPVAIYIVCYLLRDSLHFKETSAELISDAKQQFFPVPWFHLIPAIRIFFSSVGLGIGKTCRMKKTISLHERKLFPNFICEFTYSLGSNWSFKYATTIRMTRQYIRQFCFKITLTTD